MKFSEIFQQERIESHGSVQFRVLVLILQAAYGKYQKSTVDRHKDSIVRIILRGD